MFSYIVTSNRILRSVVYIFAVHLLYVIKRKTVKSNTSFLLNCMVITSAEKFTESIFPIHRKYQLAYYYVLLEK